ncbi:MAG: NADH-quinone oxidoreductase subunit K [candidate division NC10 bacterium]|nr:NADH-quinone oxidoreductase subunit K [candidate division NC10 bacterium]
MADYVTGNLIITLIVAHLIASIAAVEIRNLRASTWALCVQSLLLCSIFAAFAVISHNVTLYWWVLSTFVTKVIIVPWMLFYYIKRLPKSEVKPIIGFAASLILLFLFLVIFYRFIHTYIEFVAPTPEALIEPARSSLAIAFAIFVLGLYVLVARRDAVKIVIGLVLLENGVHLSLVTLAPMLPETTIFGITTNVIVAAFLLLYLTERVYRQLGTVDTVELSQLKR